MINDIQIRTQNPVEQPYQVWKKWFPIINTGISLKIEKVQWIILATAVLLVA
jgi:hypothetical protein